MDSSNKRYGRKRRGALETTVLILIDILMLQIAFLATYWLRFYSGIWLVPLGIPPLGMYLIAGLVVGGVFFVIFYVRDMYSSKVDRCFEDDLIDLFNGVVLGSLLVMALAFFLRGLTFSRSFFGLFFLSTYILLIVGRIIDWLLFRARRQDGLASTRVLLVGHSPERSRMMRMTVDLPGSDFEPVGWLSIPEGSRIPNSDSAGNVAADTKQPLPEIPLLGEAADVAKIVKEKDVSLVVLTIPFEQLPLINEILRNLDGLDVEIQFVPDLLTMQTSRMSLEKSGGIPFISVRTTPLSGADRFVKRTFDLAASAFGLLLICPVLLIIAIRVKLNSPGNVFYSQKRIGLNGKEFSIYKFRTMRADAESASGAKIAQKGDARTTSVGAVLRKYSLDEFPQLWNVVRGDMSLVGPRPEREVFVEQYRHRYPRYSERHTVKGGLTGWAQVNGLRGDTSIEERTMYDLHYIENWSLARDVKILLMTIRHVLKAENAY